MSSMNCQIFAVSDIVAVAAIFAQCWNLSSASMKHGFAGVLDFCAFDGTHPIVFPEIRIARILSFVGIVCAWAVVCIERTDVWI